MPSPSCTVILSLTTSSSTPADTCSSLTSASPALSGSHSIHVHGLRQRTQLPSSCMRPCSSNMHLAQLSFCHLPLLQRTSPGLVILRCTTSSLHLRLTTPRQWALPTMTKRNKAISKKSATHSCAGRGSVWKSRSFSSAKRTCERSYARSSRLGT